MNEAQDPAVNSAAPQSREQERRIHFRRALYNMLSSHGIGADTGTRDSTLAGYLMDSLRAFEAGVKTQNDWKGHESDHLRNLEAEVKALRQAERKVNELEVCRAGDRNLIAEAERRAAANLDKIKELEATIAINGHNERRELNRAIIDQQSAAINKLETKLRQFEAVYSLDTIAIAKALQLPGGTMVNTQLVIDGIHKLRGRIAAMRDAIKEAAEAAEIG